MVVFSTDRKRERKKMIDLYGTKIWNEEFTKAYVAHVGSANNEEIKLFLKDDDEYYKKYHGENYTGLADARGVFDHGVCFGAQVLKNEIAELLTQALTLLNAEKQDLDVHFLNTEKAKGLIAEALDLGAKRSS
jgi:hypothetical protein